MERNEVIKKVFSTFEKEQIKYCILRNYEFLEEEREIQDHSEKSLDLVTARKGLPAFKEVMNTLGFQPRNPGFSKAHHAYFKVFPFGVVSFDVQIGGVHWNDICYLDEEYVVGNRVRKAFFYIPSPEDTFVMLLLHSILGKRYFKPKYQEILRSLSQSKNINKEYVLARLTEVFSPTTAKKLLTLAMQNDFKIILQKKYSYIFRFVFQSPNSIGKFTLLSIRWLWSRRIRIYPLIAVIGPDGAGKSTTVQALQKYLKEHGKKSTVIYTGRGRGQLLPFASIGRKYKTNEKKKDAVNTAHNSVTIKKRTIDKRKILYSLAAPVFAMDLWLRYWIKIFPQRLQKKIVITDRYCTDLFLMQHVPLWLKKGLLCFFPRPTATFYLSNTADELHSRREEESIGELRRQLALFEKLQPILKTNNIITEDKKITEQTICKQVTDLLYREWY